MKVIRKNIKKVKKTRRPTLTKRRSTKPPKKQKKKELTILERIALVTQELHALRSRLANAGDEVPPIGIHRITALEHELDRLWDLRRQEQAAPLRATALTEEEEKNLAYPSGGQSRGY
ncbi:MAG: DUF2630 family protein [Verrucomicrobiae bacterium]|nr:DUF2630 family protein [Verrucomicrobiae bacterium]